MVDAPRARETRRDGAICYVIDADDAIESVTGPWDAFAIANGAPALTAASVIGRRLDEFITDLATSHIYRRLVGRVRRDARTVPLELRCDGPHCRRWLRLTVQPVGDRRVRFESLIVREEPREPVALLDRSVPRAGDPVRICSWCDSVHTPRGWCELEVALSALGLFDPGPPPPITHGICPGCASQYDVDRATGDSE